MNNKIKKLIEKEERCGHMADGIHKCGGKLKYDEDSVIDRFNCQKCNSIYYHMVPARYVV